MPNQITIVADNIRSLENIGSLFRIADAIGAQKLIFVGISGYPDMKENDTRRPWLREKQDRQIRKSSLKTIEYTPFERYETVTEAIKIIQSQKTFIVCVEQNENSVPFNSKYEIKYPCCLVFGNELTGVSKEFLDAADLILEVKQHGKGKSLNVSVCAGIVAFHIINNH